MLKSSLRDYSDVYMLASKKITTEGARDDTARQGYKRNKDLI